MTAIMLFAAGLGTRMGALTKDQPKPMIPVAGRPLIDHALQFTNLPQITKKVVNLHYKPQALRDHLRGSDVVFSDETDLLRDTGGALKHALPLLGSDPVVTLNTDAVWLGANPIPQLLSQWRDDMEGLLLLIPRTQVHGHKGEGDFDMATDGRINYGFGPIYSGLQILRTDRLHDIKDDVFWLRALWNQMIDAGTLYGTTYTGEWCDVGQPESIPLAERLLEGATDVSAV